MHISSEPPVSPRVLSISRQDALMMHSAWAGSSLSVFNSRFQIPGLEECLNTHHYHRLEVYLRYGILLLGIRVKKKAMALQENLELAAKAVRAGFASWSRPGLPTWRPRVLLMYSFSCTWKASGL